jgi:AAA ATPase domain
VTRAGAAPSSLVLVGEAGIGKSTLWRLAADGARDAGLRVLSCRPNAAEAALSYAALGDLLAPALDETLGELAPPLRRALEVALLLKDAAGLRPDQRAVGVGVLGVLRALAANRPLVLAIDDVQWVDPASAAALEFALRRLEAEPASLLGARRAGVDGGLEFADAASVEVGPLSLGATHQLGADHRGRTEPSRVMSRG